MTKMKIKWIDLGDGEYKCPKCEGKFYYGFDIVTFADLFPCCPRCDAAMIESEQKEK